MKIVHSRPPRRRAGLKVVEAKPLWRGRGSRRSGGPEWVCFTAISTAVALGQPRPWAYPRVNTSEKDAVRRIRGSPRLGSGSLRGKYLAPHACAITNFPNQGDHLSGRKA